MLSNMTALRTALCLGVALLLCTATSVWAQGPPGGKVNPPPNPPPASVFFRVTVIIDCAAGDSINDALETRARRLTILVDGFPTPCIENVVINRDSVILQGANVDLSDPDNPGPPVDVIEGVPSVDRLRGPSFGNVVVIRDARNVTVQHLSLRKGTRGGIRFNGLGRFTVRNCELTGNTEGLSVRGGIANVRDTTVNGNFRFDEAQGRFLGSGITVERHGELDCRRCIIENNLPAVLPVEVPPLPADALTRASESALNVLIDSRAVVRSSEVKITLPAASLFRSSTRVSEGSSVEISEGSELTGPVILSGKSQLLLGGGAFQGDLEDAMGNPIFNFIFSDSLLQISSRGGGQLSAGRFLEAFQILNRLTAFLVRLGFQNFQGESLTGVPLVPYSAQQELTQSAMAGFATPRVPLSPDEASAAGFSGEATLPSQPLLFQIRAMVRFYHGLWNVVAQRHSFTHIREFVHFLPLAFSRYPLGVDLQGD